MLADREGKNWPPEPGGCGQAGASRWEKGDPRCRGRENRVEGKGPDGEISKRGE